MESLKLFDLKFFISSSTYLLIYENSINEDFERPILFKGPLSYFFDHPDDSLLFADIFQIQVDLNFLIIFLM